MAYDYKQDDMFYDVESLANVFTVAWYIPSANAVILSYLDDDRIIKSQENLDFIEKRIFEIHPNLKENNTQIVFEDISNTGFIKEFNTLNPNLGKLGFQSFAKRLGLANIRTHLNCKIEDRHLEGGGLKYHPAFYPVKQTDPDYNENVHGYRFGYNSTNYDLTVLAHILGNIHDNHFTKNAINQPTMWENSPITASMIRSFNDELFDSKWINQMGMRLANYESNNTGFGNFKSPAWILKRAWLLTGRYIDVSRLNEKLQKVGLKRLLGMLGLHILESEKLTGDTTIHNLDEMAELLAYNISDVVNLKVLFEHKVYQNSFIVRGKLLESYPQTVYGQVQGFPEENRELPTDTGNYINIRRDRLTRDSTSAKFVEFALAPYQPIKDIPTVSFMYPSEVEAKKLGIERTDILEDTKKFFEENITNDPNHQAHKDFMQVYKFYSSIRDKNFNSSKAYLQHYGHRETKTGQYIKNLMSEYNTNLFYHYKDENGQVSRTSCLANFSIGGIHGAEINEDVYKKDLDEYKKEKAIQDYVESLYPSATDALHGPVRITLPKHLELTDRVEKKIDKNGEIRIREFVKSGSTKKKAYWRDVQEVQLFRKRPSGNWQVHPKYTYVSVGPCHHEDFTSYYPLLLSRLSAFVNPSFHGYDENGDPADPYYEMFLQRVAKKKESKDMSLTQSEREMAFLEQDSRKLLINAASGVGDAPFDNNIRANNAIISMRIIGQLFAWRIGQAQALAGARVPSTNTDGLYTMGIPAEVNDRILEETAKDMYISIEPERLDRLVSKDSNNRIEVFDGKITSASGGTLNSWKGPEPNQSLDHPAITDYILAKYLTDESIENPANTVFNRDLAKKILSDFIKEHIQKGNPQEALRYFQWILASSTGTHRYNYIIETNKHTGEKTIKNLQHYTRIFLVKEDPIIQREVYLATRRKIDTNRWKRKQKNYKKGEILFSDIWEHDENALKILLDNNLDLISLNNNPHSEHYKDEARTQKVRAMPNEQHIEIYNKSIMDLNINTAIKMIQKLDLNAYLEMVEQTFKSWSNL